MATINIFDSRSITNAITKAYAPNLFLLNTIFKQKQKHSAKTVDFEMWEGSSALATFANDHESAAPIKKRTRAVKTYTIPRTFEKKVFSAKELQDYNTLGEVYADAATRENSANQNILAELEDLKNRVYRRREMMAASFLTTGALTISQDNIDFTYDLDFTTGGTDVESGYHTGTASTLWSADGATPIADIEDMQRLLSQRGYAGTILIMGTAATKAFLSHDDVKDTLDANNYKVGQLDLNKPPMAGVRYIGKLLGVDIYEYNQYYKTWSGDAGTLTAMWDTDVAVMLDPTANVFRQHFAPAYRIEGSKSKLHLVDLLVETNTNVDKTILEWKCESNALPFIHDPDALYALTVTS